MTDNFKANANPEKRLFISLITRDIPLIAAFLDLIDNSVNSAIEPYSDRLESANNYWQVLQDTNLNPFVNIELNINADSVEISDNASGISLHTAAEHVFKFGRASTESHEKDRLSVYGIGLKRAIFKLGNIIRITSDHIEGGFELILNVAKWETDATLPWTFDITSRPPVTANLTGTKIIVSELYDDTKRRLSDGLFIGQLSEAVAKTYTFYLSKFVTIKINEQNIGPVDINIGSNHTIETFSSGEVTCVVTAGIGIPQGDSFKDKSAGWFVFCNGRTVISADKSNLTGWGTGSTGLPIFQPKHRPFTGTVFFVSKNAEKLPWTTTKSAINEESVVWQEAKRCMARVGRSVISFLDSRYTNDGTEVEVADLKDAAGESVSVLSAVAAPKKSFDPVPKQAPETTRIQFDAKKSDIKLIANFLGRPSLSAGDVGKHTFNYFLKNEVGES